MILNKQINFVSIPRTGSNAIRELIPHKNESKENHTSIRLTSDERFSFAVIRNPIQRLVSWWKYHSELRYDPTGEIYGDNFESWVMRGCPHHWSPEFCESRGIKNPLNQWEYVCDWDGNIAVDRLLNYDELQKQFTEMMYKFTNVTTLRVLNMSHSGKTPNITKLAKESINEQFRYDFHIYNQLQPR